MRFSFFLNFGALACPWGREETSQGQKIFMPSTLSAYFERKFDPGIRIDKSLFSYKTLILFQI